MRTAKVTNLLKLRQEVYKSKKKLKSKNYVITESLTKTRYDIYNNAKTKYGNKSVWTNEGRIFAKLKNSKIITITGQSDPI